MCDKMWTNREVKNSQARGFPQHITEGRQLDEENSVLLTARVLDHSGGYWLSQETVEHWAKSSSSPSVVHIRYKGCRCSHMEGCASVPHNGTGSIFNTTLQSFASFNCGIQSGVITRLHSQKDYQIPSLLFPFK